MCPLTRSIDLQSDSNVELHVLHLYERMKRIALVTGGGSGIGAATCQALASDGLRVVSADINEDAARRTVSELPGTGHLALRLDVRDEQEVLSAFAAVERDLGSLAILVCVAGGTLNTKTYKPPIVDTPLSDWIETEILNSRSVFLCVREYLRCRRVRPVADGRIILLSSLAAQVPGSPTGAAYSAAKSAVLGFMRGAALEAGPMGITVNAICPGAIDTLAFRTTASDDAFVRIPANTPMRHVGEPAEIAAVIAFLVSPQASYMTGCTVDVNGGRRMA